MKKAINAMILGMLIMILSIAPVSAAKKPYIKVSSGIKHTLLIGKTKKIKAKTVHKKRKITYKSSKRKIATVSSKGVIKGKKYGSATIYVKAKGMKTKKIKVYVKKPVTSIKLSSSSALMLNSVGETKQIKASVNPSSKYVASSKLTYKSKFPKVATVSSKGKITAKASGYTQIIISSSSSAGKVRTKMVEVYVSITPKSITANNVNVGVLESKDIKAKITPSNATQSMNYKSKNTAIAVVNSEGVITGVKAGTTQVVITATENSKISKIIQVTVTGGNADFQWPNGITYVPYDGTNTIIDIDTAKLNNVQIVFEASNGKLYTYAIRDVRTKLQQLIDTTSISYEKDGIVLTKNSKRSANFKIKETGESYNVKLSLNTNTKIARFIFDKDLAPSGKQKVYFNKID